MTSAFFLFPSLLFLRIIGRIAFPCFLYSTIEGTKRTHHYGRYIFRLVLMSLVSMPVTPNTLNVLFLLALFSLSLQFKKYAIIFGFSVYLSNTAYMAFF
ncbi:MAG: TraX family protein [Alkalibacterium sp.]